MSHSSVESSNLVVKNITTHTVSFSLVEQGHCSKDLDLLDLTRICHGFTDFTNVKGIIVTNGLGLRVGDSWVFPGLRERSVVPDVPMVGETVTDVT